MTKCLVTKFNEVINNDSILKVGEFRFSLESTGNSKMLIFGTQSNIQISIIGNGYFTDSSGSNLGKTADLSVGNTTVYVSDGDFELSIPNKYTISGLNIRYCSIKDLAELKYSSLMGYFETSNCKVSGDISSLAGLTSLGSLGLNSTQVSGDISSLAGLTSLSSLGLNSTQVSGDISSLAGLTSLSSLGLNSTQVSGDISSLAGLKNLKRLFAGRNCYGDIAILSPILQFVNMHSNSCTWSTRPSTSTIIALESCNLGNYVDKMLQDQAQCIKPEIANEQAWQRTISVKGTRTSASDAAVATLQSKGYTVSITPA